MTKIIGPFLGPRNNDGVEIFIGLPEHSDISELGCKLLKEGQFIKEVKSNASDDLYRLFRFTFTDLNENETYSYNFYHQEVILDLEDGLSASDCKFKVLGSGKLVDSFILMSCNNPFEEEKGSADHGWAMWEDLSQKVARDDSIRLLVLGGDQLYNDDIEREFVGQLRVGEDTKDINDKVRKSFIQQHQKYWGHIAYRKVLASVPSVAMWDDHDITDGWGSRPESFDGDGFKANWKTYFELARESFKFYQAPRNPQLIPGIPEKLFTAFVDFGANRFVLADFRSERHANSKRLWSDEHEQSVMTFLRNTPATIERIFFLSPVVPFRTNFEGDRRLTLFSTCFFWLRKKMKKTFIGNILEKIPELPDLSDDLEDGLSSDANRASLERILNVLSEIIRRGKEVFLLSGDIHVGGMSEIVDTRGSNTVSILQVVSSPIAYKPMPKVVEGLTTTTSEMVISKETNGRRLFARNIGYTSKRNFVQIFPNRPKDKKRVYFYWEGHEFPVAFETSFLGE